MINQAQTKQAIVFLGIAAAIFVTFLHPPLVLTAGPSEYANARTVCAENKRAYLRDNLLPSTGYIQAYVFTDSPEEVRNEAQMRYNRCMSRTSVQVSQLTLQLLVISFSTFGLLWATQFM